MKSSLVIRALLPFSFKIVILYGYKKSDHYILHVLKFVLVFNFMKFELPELSFKIINFKLWRMDRKIMKSCAIYCKFYYLYIL